MSSLVTRRRSKWTRTVVGAAVCAAAVALPVSPTAAAAPHGSPQWTADLSVVDADDSGVVSTDGVVRLAPGNDSPASIRNGERLGMLVLPERQLDRPVNRISAEVSSMVPPAAELAIDVRGLRADGNWTEWTEIRPDAPAVLPEPTTRVQVRAMLSAAPGSEGPELSRLTLSADSVPTAHSSAGTMAAPLSYQVFATREGLVGGTTANGHVIKERDHFVALPSRRGLSSKNNGEYSVQVCASNGRCEWAPVWDVGPWNTKDDYWNPSSTREMWKDLPQGKPEAQAAYQNGYNGGKDQFGRTVLNPAGIDLADGTFWDGLKLTNNAWVTVTYLWTGTGTFGQVRTAGDPLNVRSGPSTSYSQVGLAANYAKVRVECQVTGQSVSGYLGTSNIWYRISSGKYVSKAYVSGVSSAPSC
ncbi:MAG TPA: SH3 domain-containing protein [Pseudonocardiaceae bacterium]